MSSILECVVREPPTSGEVRKKVAEAISRRALLKLTVLSNQEVPKPSPIDLEVDIKRTTHPDIDENQMTRVDGWLRHAGSDSGTGQIAVVNINSDPDIPATVSLVGD